MVSQSASDSAPEPSAAPEGGAVLLRDRLASGALDAERLVGSCLEHIANHEQNVQAWAWLDSDHALKQAKLRDTQLRAGHPIGSLHGLPVGVKDIIDTAGIPTENGTEADKGRVPTRDAFVVEQLKAAGAIVIGKTVTTELAFMEPSKTRNPHNHQRSPGGSSSGSAAAVASGMVPLAIGTQTGGSVIRPAAFCGVTGFKPSFGHVPRLGVLAQSQSLDTIGMFGRNVEDVALLADALVGHHADDPASSPKPHQRLLETSRSTPPMTPVFAFARTPYWNMATNEMQEALEELAQVLGEQCFETELPGAFAEASSIRACINQVEMAKNFHSYRRFDSDKLSTVICEFMSEGDKVLAKDYLSALDLPDVLNAGLHEVFERCDAILTVAAPGSAPTLETTGDSVFNGTWTLCGNPAITLPLFSDTDGMPMGVQLVGRRGDDGRLLRTARWLEQNIASLS